MIARLRLLAGALSLILCAGFAHAAPPQTVYCQSGSVPCTTSGPENTGTGDQPYLAFGKINVDFNTIFGNSFTFSVPSIFTVTGSPVTAGAGAITIGYSGTPLPFANGGTNATSASAALANLLPAGSALPAVTLTPANIVPAEAFGSCNWTPAANPTTDIGPCVNLAAATAPPGAGIALPASDTSGAGVNGFGVTTPIVLPANGVHLVGAGLQYSGSNATTSLIATSSFPSSGTMITIAAPSPGEISDTDVQGININANNYAKHGLHVTSLSTGDFEINCMNAGGGGPSSPTTGTGAQGGGAECITFDTTTAGNGNQNIHFRRLYGSSNNYATIARFDTGGSPGAKNSTNSSQSNFDEIFINMGNALGDGIVFGDMDNIDVRGSVRCQGGCKGNATAGTFGAGLPFVVGGGGGLGSTGLNGGGWMSPNGVSTNGSQQHPQIRIHHTSIPIYVAGFRDGSTITQVNGSGTEAPKTISLTATTNGGNWPAAGTDVIWVTVDPTTIGAVPGMVLDCGNGEMDSGVPHHDPIVATNAPSTTPYFVQLLHAQISLQHGGIQNAGTVTACAASYGITKYAAINSNGNGTLGIYNVGYFTGTGSIVSLGSFTGTATNGTYTSVSLTGGGGTGAVGTVTVAGGVVTNVTITTPGTGYAKNNVLSFTVTGGSGTATVTYACTAAGWCISAPAGGDSQNGISATSYTGANVLAFTDMAIPLTTASPSNGDIFTVTTMPAAQEIAVNGTDFGNAIAIAQFQPGSSGNASYEVLNAEAPFKADTADYPGTYQGWSDSADMQAIRTTNNGQGFGSPIPYWFYEFGYRDYGGVGSGLHVEGTINSPSSVDGAAIFANIDCYGGTGCASGTTLIDIGTNVAKYYPNGVSPPGIANHLFTMDAQGNVVFAGDLTVLGCTGCGGATLQTNGANNSSQTALNLESSGNIQVTNSSGGNVTFQGTQTIDPNNSHVCVSTSTYTVLATDQAALITLCYTGASQAIALPVGTTTGFGPGWSVDVTNYGTATATFTPGSPSTIANGGTTLPMAANTSCTISIDNANNYQVSACTATTGSTLTGVVRGGSPLAASEISGDCTTSGSNAITCTKTNGNGIPPPVSANLYSCTAGSCATWTKPATYNGLACSTVRIIAIGSGGGGGAGASLGASTAASGGAGGGGGAMLDITMPCSQMGSTATVTAGAAPAGATGVANSAGATGTQGNNTVITSASVTYTAYGGGAGGGGQSAANSTGGAGGNGSNVGSNAVTTSVGGAGAGGAGAIGGVPVNNFAGSGGGGGSDAAVFAGGSASLAAAGGGSGGWMLGSSQASEVGAAGGRVGGFITGGAAGGAAGNGTQGNAAVGYQGGSGAGGGGSTLNGTGGNGGNGGTCGGGGGGGGSVGTSTANVPGNGGNGGIGCVWIITTY